MNHLPGPLPLVPLLLRRSRVGPLLLSPLRHRSLRQSPLPLMPLLLGPLRHSPLLLNPCHPGGERAARQRRAALSAVPFGREMPRERPERCRHQSPVIRHPSSVISHQSSVISHRSSVISHQPSAISHQSSVISHQSSVISHQSSRPLGREMPRERPERCRSVPPAAPLQSPTVQRFQRVGFKPFPTCCA